MQRAGAAAIDMDDYPADADDRRPVFARHTALIRWIVVIRNLREAL
jgi:hypothetical protein